MSLRTKLSAAINGDAMPTDVPEQDAEFAKARKRLSELESKQPEIEQRANYLAGELREKQRAMRKAALEKELGDESAPYEHLAKEVEKLRLDFEAAQHAATGIEELITDAKREVHRLTVAGVLKTMRRKQRQREKAEAEMRAGLKAAINGATKLREINDEILFAWPVGILGYAPEGAILADNELERALVREISRLAPPAAINPRFTFPGAHYEPVLGDPTFYRTLEEELKLAGQYLLRCIEQPGATAPPQAPDIVLPNEPAAVLNDVEPAPSGPMRSATEIMAAMKPKQLT